MTILLTVVGLLCLAAALFYASTPAWAGIAPHLLLVGLGFLVLAFANSRRGK